MPVEWAEAMMSLATAYSDRIRGDRAENIERAIDAYQQALQVMTRQAMPVEWAQTMMNLANAYSSRIRGDRAENIEQAIDAYQQALQVMTRQAMPVEWAETMMNLANAYSIPHSGRPGREHRAGHRRLPAGPAGDDPPGHARRVGANHDEPGERLLCPHSRRPGGEHRAGHRRLPAGPAGDDPPGHARRVGATMMNLATAYSNRIRGDRAENIEHAIDAYQQALEVRTRQAMPVEWAQAMMNLATAYSNRIRGDQAENIEHAIDAYQQALEVRTRQAMPVEWAQAMMNLVTAYYYRIRGDEAENIEQAIDAYQQALQVMTRQAMPVEWAQVMMNLATAYSKRIRGDRAENIEQAIAAYGQALQVMTRQAMPVDWAQTMMNLANAYFIRIRGDRAENIEQAIDAYQQALEVFTPVGLPHHCRGAARSLTNLYFDEGRFEQVAEPYQLAMQAVENLLQASLVRGSKEVELGEIQGLPARAAYALAKTGKAVEAVVALERGRARLLAEALEQSRRDLERLPELGHGELLERYRQVAGRIQFLQQQAGQRAEQREQQPALSNLAQEMAAARAELNAAIAAIRQVEVDGQKPYADLWLPPTFEKIQKAAAPGASLVYLLTTSTGSLALVVAGDKVEPLWMDNLNEARLREVLVGPAGIPELGGYLGAYDRWKRQPRGQAARAAWHDALDFTAHWLWDALMGPLVEFLGTKGVQQATVIPAGSLGLLPLHAAWTEDATSLTGRRYAMDLVTLTYAPSAGALAASREVAGRVTPDAVLAVDNPDGSLVFSRQEVEAVRSYFRSERAKVLQGAAAARQAVLDHLPNFPIYHLSTHGWAGWDEPLQGGLLLAGGSTLTLADLLDLRLEGRGWPCCRPARPASPAPSCPTRWSACPRVSFRPGWPVSWRRCGRSTT